MLQLMCHSLACWFRYVSLPIVQFCSYRCELGSCCRRCQCTFEMTCFVNVNRMVCSTATSTYGVGLNKTAGWDLSLRCDMSSFSCDCRSQEWLIHVCLQGCLHFWRGLLTTTTLLMPPAVTYTALQALSNSHGHVFGYTCLKQSMVKKSYLLSIHTS